MRPLQPIERFLLRVVLWLPPLFVLWYLLAPLLLAPVAGWSHWLLTTWFPQAITGVERQGISLEILTRFMMAAPADGATPPGATGTLTFSLNALKYAYGWPLLLALTLAAPLAPSPAFRCWAFLCPALLNQERLALVPIGFQIVL